MGKRKRDWKGNIEGRRRSCSAEINKKKTASI